MQPAGPTHTRAELLKSNQEAFVEGPQRLFLFVALLNTTSSLLMLQRLQPFLQAWRYRAERCPGVVQSPGAARSCIPLSRQKTLQGLHQGGCLAGTPPKGDMYPVGLEREDKRSLNAPAVTARLGVSS